MNDTSSPRWITPAGLLPVVVSAALFAYFAQMVPVIAAGDTLRFVWSWVPSLGVNISFLIDGLSLTFALLITGIGAVVMLYSARYLAGHHHQARFSFFLTSFMLAMLGVVLSDNLLGLFVFWELTTITSYLLIRVQPHHPEITAVGTAGIAGNWHRRAGAAGRDCPDRQCRGYI